MFTTYFYLFFVCIIYFLCVIRCINHQPLFVTYAFVEDVIELEQWNELLETSSSAEETNCQNVVN